MDETTAQADLILPDHTYLERWQDDPMLPIAPYTVFWLRQPAVAPLFETRHTGDVMLQLAHTLGGAVEHAFPWPDFVAVLHYGVRSIYEAQAGAIIEAFTQQPWMALLEERGVWQPSYNSFEEFWQQLLDKGGWWDPGYPFGEWRRGRLHPQGYPASSP